MKYLRNHPFLQVVIISLLLMLIVTGCTETENPDQLLDPQEGQVDDQVEEVTTTASLSSFFPFQEGMVYHYAGEGNEYAAFRREVKYAQKPYLQIHDNNGGTEMAKVYQIGEKKVDLMFEQEEFYQDTNIIDQLGENKPPIEALIKAPLEVGNSWSITREREREIIGVNETLEVPAGIFNRVLVIKISSTQEGETAVTKEYYAENVGLIMREFQDGDVKITSRLATYGIPVEKPAEVVPNGSEEREGELTLTDPHLGLLAYQLDRELRALYQSAYESYINLDSLATSNDRNFDQIIAVYRAGIQPLTVENQVMEQVKRLEDLYRAGEGEVTFPTHEVVQNVTLIAKSAYRARVAISLTKYFPEREWSGKAHSRTFDYIISLVKEGGRWKIEQVSSDG